MTIVALSVAIVLAAIALAASRTSEPTARADCRGAPAYAEIRDANTPLNQTPGDDIPSDQYQPWNPGFRPYLALVNGQGCLGTTEQILEWAAIKWGFADKPSPFGGPPLHHPDILKAVAVAESDWRQWHSGDIHGGECDWVNGPDCPYPYGAQSYSLLGIKRTSWPGSYPLSAQSTAFAADYYGAVLRHHYDGASWLPSLKDDLWCSVGAWYSGMADCPAWYVDGVRHWYLTKPWRESWFETLYP